MIIRLNFLVLILILFLQFKINGQEYIKSIKQVTFDLSVDYFPAWSPDGEYLLYSSRVNTSNIYKIPSSGGNPVRLTNIPSGHPTYSPDGLYFSFDNYKTNNIQIVSSSKIDQIKTVTEEIPGQKKRHSCYSHDGKRLAFSVDGDIYILELFSGDFSRIYHKEGFSARPFCWSINDSELLIDLKDNKFSKSSVWYISNDGKTSRQIADFQGDETSPDISPDGSLIVFTSNQSGNQDIWLMSSNGNVKIQLTSDCSRDMNPRWSPDGNKIAFASERNGNRNIWIMELDISALKKEIELILKTP